MVQYALVKGMHSLKLQIALILAVALGVAGLCVFTMRCQADRKVVKPSPPPLDLNLAEGFRLWNPKTGVDSVRFESCSVQKKRMGSIALGAFNVLCIKGLELNLPLDLEEEMIGRRGSGLGDQNAEKDAFAGLSPKSLMERTGLVSKKFSGVMVDDLKVNRVVNRSEVVPVFAAEKAKDRGKSLALTNCRVFADDGSTNFVAKATLKLKPVPVLAWNGGERRLDDLLK